MKVHKPNVAAVHAEAARIKERIDNKGSGGSREKRDLNFYNWRTEGEKEEDTGKLSDGVNYIRVLPPYKDGRVEGFGIFRQIYTWKNLPGIRESFKHLKLNWPDKEVDDYIETVLDKIRAFATGDLEDKVNDLYPRMNVYANVIDRKNQAKGVQICWFPPSFYDWFVMKFSEMLAQGVDITDPDTGVDLKIVRSKNVDGWYQKQLLGTETPDGFTPLSSPVSKDEAIREAILSSLYDLDRVFRFPNEEQLAKYSAAAETLYTVLTGERKSTAPEPPPRVPAQTRQKPVEPPVVPPSDPPPKDVSDAMRDIQNESDIHAEKSEEPPRAPTELSDRSGSAAVPPVPPAGSQPPTPPLGVVPGAKPICYQDHQPGHSKCLMCPLEFDCMDDTGKSRVLYDWSNDPNPPKKALVGR